ncbi:hypothetical protein ACT3UG_01095 [Halomonas sp. AOP27-A1-34]|uniref:hypothetical protein n=1 Tax=Halomonas sp. AOP27-A1-34 TaxID=3457708 RepID=UPI004033B203
MSEYTQGVCHDGAAILKDGKPLTIEQILEGLRERDEYRNHLAAIAEMTGNGDDIGAAHEGVNALAEDLARYKRMFAAACETLGEIQQALGNSVVGIEPELVKELIKERAALARFANEAVTTLFDSPGCDIDGKCLEDWLLDEGIIFGEPFEPNGKHSQSTLEDVEEGETILQCSQWFSSAARQAAKAEE